MLTSSKLGANWKWKLTPTQTSWITRKKKGRSLCDGHPHSLTKNFCLIDFRKWEDFSLDSKSTWLDFFHEVEIGTEASLWPLVTSVPTPSGYLRPSRRRQLVTLSILARKKQKRKLLASQLLVAVVLTYACTLYLCHCTIWTQLFPDGVMSRPTSMTLCRTTKIFAFFCPIIIEDILGVIKGICKFLEIWRRPGWW